MLCLNGPNLDRLGIRQPEVYGSKTLPELEASVVDWGRALDFEVRCLQSNHEGDIVEALHGAADYTGVVFNPGALTHTSAAVGDAVASIETPVVEVHISNVRARMRWRRRSYVEPEAVATIFGRGPEGYRAALRHLLNRGKHPVKTHRYGPHPDQVFDVRPGPGSTGVVLVHGGFWLDAWGRDTMESWAVDLAERGFATANLEYRRLGSGGGAIPTLSDVSRAMTVAANALDSDRVVVVGHSAGAHLALNVAHRPGFPGEAVVSVGGVLDLEEAAAARRGDGSVERFDPSHETSPLTAPLPPVPVLLAHGEADRVVPADHSRVYDQHLSAGDVPHRLSVLEGIGHFDALDPSTGLWDRVMSDLKDMGLA